nr:hypothetical protein CFP56_56085 [Quercus suber]
MYIGTTIGLEKSVELSIETSKRSRGEASTAASASGDMPIVEEVHMDPTAIVDPTGDDDVVDPTITLPLSLRTMIESFMTTQVAHGQLLDKLLTEVASLKADTEYRRAFPPLPPSDP